MLSHGGSGHPDAGAPAARPCPPPALPSCRRALPPSPSSPLLPRLEGQQLGVRREAGAGLILARHHACEQERMRGAAQARGPGPHPSPACPSLRQPPSPPHARPHPPSLGPRLHGYLHTEGKPIRFLWGMACPSRPPLRMRPSPSPCHPQDLVSPAHPPTRHEGAVAQPVRQRGLVRPVGALADVADVRVVGTDARVEDAHLVEGREGEGRGAGEGHGARGVAAVA
jgi:hypothetical protein